MLLSNEQTKRSSWEYFLLRAAREISLSEAQYEKTMTATPNWKKSSRLLTIRCSLRLISSFRAQCG